MKRCSTCNRTYTDPNLSFCIDDGTPLTTVETEDDTTVVRPRDTTDDEWNAAAYRPPTAYVPPGTGAKPRRRVWPWVVGIGAAFILGILAISIAAVILAPRLMRNDRGRVGVGPANSNTAENRNSNTGETTSNTNSNATERVDTPPPADHEQVLAHLKDLENEWMVANINADRKTLDRILADDYVGQGPGEEGRLEVKADYLRRIERDTDTEKWEFSDQKLTLAGDRATLTGIVTFFFHDGNVVSADFKDKFVWRDGRWQATGSELKRRENVGTPL
jgi:hypothetical protein